MTSALYVRETLELSDATEQRLLHFARRSGLRTGDTLVAAALTMTASPGYFFDLRDPSDPTYLLNLVLVADTLDATALTVDVTGAPATKPADVGRPGRSARVIARDIRRALVVRATGGAGTAGVPGRVGADETFTIEYDDKGKPYREYEAPTPGEPGGNGGAGGSGGTARVLSSIGSGAQVTASGGTGGAAGAGGSGGKGALTPQGQRRPGAADGHGGQPGPSGLAGTAVSLQAPGGDFWVKARAELGADLVEIALHWLRVAEYRYRLVRGTPTPAEADIILNLLDAAAAADPARTDAVALKAQFLNGDNALGIPRNLDVVADFERYLRRVDVYGTLVDGLFDDAKNLLAATSAAGLTEAQLQVQLTTLDFTATVLEATLADAMATSAVARAEEKAATARWTSTLDQVSKRRVDLEQPIDWGGVVVVGLFAIVSLIADAYVGQYAGKLIGSIPDLMALGNVKFSGSDKETKVLKDAISAGGDLSKIRTAGAKDAAGHQNSDGMIDVEAWAADSVPVLISFAKFVKDMDEATGDPELKQLVKDLAMRLQEKLAATARVGAASRQVDLATMRIQGVNQERASYAQLHAKARDDLTLLRETAVSLLGVVRRHGDVFLDYQIRAARAVEIYTRSDQSAAMGLDRWHVHPDVELDFEEDLIDAVAYQSQLLASTTELAVGQLVSAFDAYDLSRFQPDVHYVTIKDPGLLDTFRTQLTTSVTVDPGDLAGERWEAKVVAAAVSLQGVTAATPSFALVVTHGSRCTDRLKDGTEVTQFLEPRTTLVQVTAAQGEVVTGAAAIPISERPTEFWRRSVATEWLLSIEPGVVESRKVDLNALTSIDLTWSYIALRP